MHARASMSAGLCQPLEAAACIPGKWVREKAAVVGLDRDVFITCLYSPPAGFSQLHSQNLPASMASLRRAVIFAQEHGHVIFGAHFNARVGTMNQVLLPDRQFLEDFNLPARLLPRLFESP